MKTFLSVFQIVISVLLVVGILSQSKGAGLGTAFGGTDTFYHTKRGPEKVLFIMTVTFAVFFILSSAAFIFVD